MSRKAKAVKAVVKAVVKASRLLPGQAPSGDLHEPRLEACKTAVL
jgi:hypothetical protein